MLTILGGVNVSYKSRAKVNRIRLWAFGLISSAIHACDGHHETINLGSAYSISHEST